MKCPYPECRKDYNDSWPKIMANWVIPSDALSIHDRGMLMRLFIVTRQCRFCGQHFHEVSVGHENFDPTKQFAPLQTTLDPLANYPISKTKFEAKDVPEKITVPFNEAERCRAVGSLTGAAACLRKSIYALCDEQRVEGSDYRKKIENLKVKNQDYLELLKQIKWLGDTVTKPGEELYTKEQVDLAIEILPEIVDDLYLIDERVETAGKLLAKVRSSLGMKDDGRK
jgi:hypothetical protein